MEERQIVLPLYYITHRQRFHIVVGLLSNRSQMTSKCGKIVIDIGLPLVRHFFCSHHMCGVICDVLMNRPTAPWNLIVHLMIFERKKKEIRGHFTVHLARSP